MAGLGGRVGRLEAARSGRAGQARVIAVTSTHDRGAPGAVRVWGADARLSEEAFRRRYPAGILVVRTCYCPTCTARRREATEEGAAQVGRRGA
jgi:hypothetical protein